MTVFEALFGLGIFIASIARLDHLMAYFSDDKIPVSHFIVCMIGGLGGGGMFLQGVIGFVNWLFV